MKMVVCREIWSKETINWQSQSNINKNEFGSSFLWPHLLCLNTSCSNYSKREKRDHTPITSLFWLSLDEWNKKCSTTKLIQPSWLIWLSFRKRPVFQTIRVRRNDDEKSLWWRYIWAQLQASIPETMLKQICITVIFLCYFESLKFERI